MVLLKESDRIKMSYKKVGAFKKWQKCFRDQSLDENERRGTEGAPNKEFSQTLF
jgi:hypothetical protein